MSLTEFFSAVCLVFVLEGLLPFIAPERWKAAMRQMAEVGDETLRMIGLGSMILGIVLLTIIRQTT